MKAKNEPTKGRRKTKSSKKEADAVVTVTEASENPATEDVDAADVPAVTEEIHAEVPTADEHTIEKIDALIMQVERAAQGLPTEEESTDASSTSDDESITDDEAITVSDSEEKSAAEENVSEDAEPTSAEGSRADESEPTDSSSDSTPQTEEAELSTATDSGEECADGASDGADTSDPDTDEHIDIPVFDLDLLDCEPSAEDGDALNEGAEGDSPAEDGEMPTDDAADPTSLSELIDREAEVIPFLSLSDSEAAEDNGAEEIEEPAPSEEVADATSAVEEEPHSPSEQKPKKARPDGGKRRIDSIFDMVELCVFTLAAVLVIIAFFFRHAIVDGPSMDHTLAHGDNLIISDFMYEPEVGDIVVVEDHSISGPNYPIVKRIVALGGQLVRIEADGIYVDDELEPFASKTATPEDFNYIENICLMTEKYPGTGLDILKTYDDFEFVAGAFIEFRVPEGEIFLVGDNRDNSTDSRSFGSVGEESIIGKLLLRIYPFGRFGTVG
ncbi:MAG: signal peptidase I [Clostridia bacterium]|nr:signal peptidase I [Clostridia bacterium]